MRTLMAGLCAATLIAAPACAADLGPVKAPPPPAVAAPVFTWTGVYVGANIGGAWSQGTVTDNITGLSFDLDNNSGFIGGGQAGLNWQLNWFLLGVEWDIDGTTFSQKSGTGTFGGAHIQASANMDWISTLTGRIGFVAFDRWLVYAKGGGAWVQNSVTFSVDNTSASSSHIDGGWTAGVGVEWAFAPQWSAKLEYDYIKLDDFNPTLLGDTVNELSRHINMVKVGINYRFNWGGPGELVRGY